MSFLDQFGNSSGGRGGRIRADNYDMESGSNLFSSPYEYDNNIQAVSNNIKEISTSVGQVKQMATNIGTSKDSAELREKMNYLIQSTQRTVKLTAEEFKTLNITGTPEERNRKKVLHGKLMKDFQTWIQKFQEISQYAIDKEKSTPLSSTNSRPSAQKSPYNQPSILDTAIDMNPPQNQYNNQLQFQNEIDFNDALLQDRAQGIRDIEKAVIEVNEIFRDVSTLVVEQGHLIDNIESNIESAAVSTGEGVVQLRQASNHQRKARTKLCVLALILTLVLAAIIVLVWIFV